MKFIDEATIKLYAGAGGGPQGLDRWVVGVGILGIKSGKPLVLPVGNRKHIAGQILS